MKTDIQENLPKTSCIAFVNMEPGDGEFNLYTEFKRMIIKALTLYPNDTKGASIALGVTERSLYRYINFLNIERSLYIKNDKFTLFKKFCRENGISHKTVGKDNLYLDSLHITLTKIPCGTYRVTDDSGTLIGQSLKQIKDYALSKLKTKTHENH